MKTSTSQKSRRPRGETQIKHITPAQALERGEGYVVIPAPAVAKLGPFALKAFNMLLNRSKDFQWSKDHLRRVTGMSYGRTQQAVGELKEAGYLKTGCRTGVDGRKAGQRWWITTTPFDWSEFILNEKTANSKASHRGNESRHRDGCDDNSIIYPR